MDAGHQVVDTRPDARRDLKTGGRIRLAREPLTVAPGVLDEQLDTLAPPRSRWATFRYAIGIYVVTRIALFLVALIGAVVFPTLASGPNSVTNELANWDGWWYVHAMTAGWPTQVLHGQTTLGFLPLYPVVGWLVAHVLFCSYVVAGFVVSLAGGLVSALLIQQLATDWWGAETAKKAVLAFCLFPGSVVFSMVYSEGLLIPLVAGCMLALSRRRWLLAGALAGLATAIGPDALCVIPLCAAASYLELRRRGWRDRSARESLTAVMLAPLGAVAAAGFFWLWTGSPTASYVAQHDGWHEKTSIFAIPHQISLMLTEIGFHLAIWHVDLNVALGLIGVVFLFYGLRYLWRERTRVPVPVLVFVGCMSFLVLTSWGVPPNPRMLITAFPVVLVFAKYLEGRAWTRFLWISGVAFVVLSLLTYTGGLLRP
jgi:hypothetical protein